MSTRGVMRMMTSILSQNNGRMTEAAYKEVIEYAKKGAFTEGEKKALLQPGNYLANSRYMRAANVTLDTIKFDVGAVALAKELAANLGIDIFPGLPATAWSDAPAGTTPVTHTTAAALAALVENRDTALAKGKLLGSFEDWNLQTSGADLKFAVTVGNNKFPALVLDKPQWEDPAARNLLKDHMSAFANVSSIETLAAFVEDVLKQEKSYFDADGIDVKNRNQRFGIQGLRRELFFAAIRDNITETTISPADRRKINGVLIPAEESLLLGRDYRMDVGSHTNYWPYWNNYVDFLLKVLDQTDPNTDAYLNIKNRVSDILRRKTVFGWNRSIDEKDFETSVSGAVIHNPQYSSEVGHRVSIKAGSTVYQPSYETLTVKADLPDDLKEYAGAQVFRDGDELRFDFMGKDATPDRTGQPLPDALKAFIVAEDVDFDDLNIRKLVSGEKARKGVSMDWNQNGAINIAKIMIGWWGHCHNEAPGNAMGVDPKKGVDIYRADRGVAADGARASYSSEDAWDVFGAFAADHEEGFGRITSGGRLQPTRVDDTTFVGNRNNGGHWLNLSFDDPTRRRVRIDAEVTELWHRSDPTKKYPRPMERFRRDAQNDDGTFGPNPDWVATDMRDNDLITVDAKSRQMTVKVKYVTLNSAGMPFEKEASVHLDPTKDEFVHLADELSDRNPAGGGKLVEHWYNPKSAEYKSKSIEVSAGNNFERTLIEESAAVATGKVLSSQETTYDSVMQIHDFVTDDIGLPFTFDTSSGMAVWNYPVDYVRVDRQKTVSKVEDGESFTYTTYKLDYSTMGGPTDQSSRYIIKRDVEGRMVRALALDPMPDFAYRNEHWVCAPVALDVNGDVAYNLKGLSAGYLTDKARAKLTTALWERQGAILYASLSDETAKNRAYVYETEDGRLISFATKDEFDAAVAADLKVREAEANIQPD